MDKKGGMMKWCMLMGIVVLPGVSLSQYCIPQANCSWDDYINGVVFAGISNLNSGCSPVNGYGNYTYLVANVIAGNSYNITIYNNPIYDEYIGVWIDFNGDGDFNDAGEFVFSGSVSANSFLSGSITIPMSAAVGLTRMRVRCRWGTALGPGDACSTVSYGETEDYSVNINMPSPPIAGFISSDTTCTGTVYFIDTSKYAVSWTWYFGDGTTSNQQNPVHTYASPGTYHVTLTVCNSLGCDNAYATVTYVSGGGGVAPASCTPQTLNYCCGFGIREFAFHTIHNVSGDGSEGYQDFTCYVAHVYAGRYYPLLVRVDQPAPHSVKIWIDYNGDGSFSSAELVYSKSQTYLIQDSIYIQPAALLNTPLRMRVWADYYLQPRGGPCVSPQNGQVEDYAVVIHPNPYPPVARFYSPDTVSCDGIVRFYDLSLNLPVSWVWHFGDGTTSTQQNPVHQYSQSGVYNVTLMVFNNNGGDTLVKYGYITVNLGGGPAPASCKPQTQSYCCDYGIYAVTLNNVQVSSGGGWEGYVDFSCGKTDTFYLGVPYTITIYTGSANHHDVQVWIDTNGNGNFESGELFITSHDAEYHTGTIHIVNIPAGVGVPVRLRIVADYVGSPLSACYSPLWGQVEDYSVVFVPAPVPPTASFTVDSVASCPGPVSFVNNSVGGVSFTWLFGDGSTSNVFAPVHSYAPGEYVVTLIASNAYGSDTVYSDTLLVHPGFCNHYVMSVNDTLVINDCAGYIYDSGGPTSPYSNNSNSAILIQNSQNKKIKLVILEGDYELGFDTLYIYDGSGGVILGYITGVMTPAPKTYYSSGNSLLIVEHTDFSVVRSGFKAYFYCVDTITGSYVETPYITNTRIFNTETSIILDNREHAHYCAVYDGMGRLAMMLTPTTTNTSTFVIPKEKMSRGIYLVVISHEKGIEKHKVVIY